MAAASMLGLLLLHAAAGGAAPRARSADCAAYAEVRAQIARAREMLARGASQDELPALEGVEPALRTCFREQVLPALVRAETNDQLIDGAADGFFTWARQPALLGISERFAAEDAEGIASLTKGLSHAYAVARDKCVRLHDTRQIDVMLRLLRYAQLRGIELTTAFDDDIAACIRGAAYLVQVRVTSTTAGRGVGSDLRYTAVLRPVPRASDGELAGKGSWAGFVVARKANCVQAEEGGAERFDIGGSLAATGAVLDLAAPGSRPAASLVYTLQTLDWPLKLLFGDAPFAESAEEREALAGAGTIGAFQPIALTGRETTKVESTTLAITCGRETTMRTETRLVRMAASR